MKHGFAAFLCLAIFTALAPGCRAAEGRIPQSDAPESVGVPVGPPATVPHLVHDYPVAPVQGTLTPEAEELYSYLVLFQSIRGDDETALLDAAPVLTASHAPAEVWLQGAGWLARRRSPNVIVFLEEALKSHPDDLNLNLLYANGLGNHGMRARGIEHMQAYIKKLPDALDAKLELALLLIQDHNFDAARKLLEEVSPKDRDGTWDYIQARIYMGTNRYGDAIPLLRKALKEQPGWEAVLTDLAHAYEQEGNLKEARNVYEKLQKENFSPHEVGIRLINLALRMRQPERAVQYVRQGPRSLRFRLEAAQMLMEARHYLQAESILKQIADAGPAPAEVYLLLADLVYEQRRNLNMALSWLDRIPPEDRAAPRAAALRVQLLGESGRKEQAFARLGEALKQFPDNAELREMEIRLLARDKKMKEAIEAAHRAVEKWPDNEDLEFLYGSLLDESGDRTKALEVMEDLLKKHPDNFQAMNYIGFTLAEQNRELERALTLLKKADELSPDQSYIVDSLAWAHFRSGNGPEALKQIRRAVGLGNHVDAAIWEHYGDIALKQGKKDEARRAFRRALELKPANAAKIRAKLSKI